MVPRHQSRTAKPRQTDSSQLSFGLPLSVCSSGWYTALLRVWLPMAMELIDPWVVEVVDGEAVEAAAMMTHRLRTIIKDTQSHAAAILGTRRREGKAGVQASGLVQLGAQLLAT